MADFFVGFVFWVVFWFGLFLGFVWLWLLLRSYLLLSGVMLDGYSRKMRQRNKLGGISGF